MRAWIISDLHLSRSERRQSGILCPVRVNADVCILAGDVCEGGAEAVDWIAGEIAPAMPVVFVLGNHELYGSDPETAIAQARAVAARGDHSGHPIHVLQKDAVEIQGVRFLGATLWTDYEVFGEPAWAMHEAKQGLNDHRYIDAEPVREGGNVPGLFKPEHARKLHAESRAWLESALAEPFSGPTVVVTHHAPHRLSVAPEYATSRLTAAFVSDLSEVMSAGRPTAWIHGHTHTPFDYVVPESGTRVVCNPRGYDWEQRSFQPGLILEIGVTA